MRCRTDTVFNIVLCILPHICLYYVILFKTPKTLTVTLTHLTKLCENIHRIL